MASQTVLFFRKWLLALTNVQGFEIRRCRERNRDGERWKETERETHR